MLDAAASVEILMDKRNATLSVTDVSNHFWLFRTDYYPAAVIAVMAQRSSSMNRTGCLMPLAFSGSTWRPRSPRTAIDNSLRS
jgi:hypothetical protein